MSVFMYLASDQPLPEVENPHEKFMSINEALAAGIKIADYALHGIDRDKPDVVAWRDIDETNQDDSSFTRDDFSIYPIEKSEEMFILTEKPYCACLDWNYSNERAENVIAYIKEHLKRAETVELWHIWLSSPDLPREIKRIKMSIADLDVQAVEKLEHEYEVNIQYCYEILWDQRGSDNGGTAAVFPMPDPNAACF